LRSFTTNSTKVEILLTTDYVKRQLQTKKKKNFIKRKVKQGT